MKPEAFDEFGYTSDTPLFHKPKSLFSETKEIDQKTLFETPRQFLDSAIQSTSLETQGSLGTNFRSTSTTIFTNFYW